MATYAFAGFEFPRTIPEFFRSKYNTRTMADGRTLPARMRFAYHAAPTPSAREDGFYLDSDFAPGLRWQWCDETGANIRHTGWYCDEFQDCKIRGVVFRLPHSRGFLPGWSMGNRMASVIDYSAVYDTERDAAYVADSMAENAAEQERERAAQEAEEV